MGIDNGMALFLMVIEPSYESDEMNAEPLFIFRFDTLRFQQIFNDLLYMIPVCVFIPTWGLVHGKDSMKHEKKDFFRLPFGNVIVLHNLRNTLGLLHLIQFFQCMMRQAPAFGKLLVDAGADHYLTIEGRI